MSHHMQVGGSVSGYGRWADFKKRGLSLYAATRNDAMNRNGVSRMSPYHHWGERVCVCVHLCLHLCSNPRVSECMYVCTCAAFYGVSACMLT